MPTDNSLSWWRRIPALLTNRFRRRADHAVAAERDDQKLVLSLSPSRIPTFRQLRYLPRLLTVTERRWARLFVTLAVLSLLTLAGHSAFRHVVRVPTDGGTLTEGLVGSSQFINPVLARPFTPDEDLSRLLFRGLMRVDEHLGLVPDLAESVSVSDDGKVYTVVLRPNLHWSDGTALTADDAQYTFETVADPTFQSPFQPLFKGVKIATVDQRTVTFTLPEVLEPFRSYLTLGIIPAHLWQDQTPQNFLLAELNLKPVSSGPYKFLNVTKDRTGNIKGFTFVRNKFYDGPRPLIDRVVIKMYPEATSAVDALHSNAIDAFGGIDATQVDKVEKYRQVTPFALSQLTALFFNEKTNPALKVQAVRQALAKSLDRDALIEQALHGVGLPATGPVLPGQPGYSTAAKRHEFDAGQANTLLDEAGWKRGDNGLRSKGSQSLKFSLTTVDDPNYAALAQAVAAAWTSLGATVEVKTIPAERMQKDVIRPRQYDVLLFGQIHDTDGDPYLLWHSSQQSGSGFALAVAFSKTIDRALENQRRAVDQAKHNAELLTFQNAVTDEVPAIILVQSEYLYAHLPSLRGFPGNRLVAPADRFRSIGAWYIKTRLSWK